MSDWGETKSILLELEQLFKRDDDIKDVQDVQKMAEEIDFQRSQHSRHLKTIIKRKPSFCRLFFFLLIIIRLIRFVCASVFR